MKRIPFVAFGNEELEEMPFATEGDRVDCPRCRKKHRLKCGTTDGKKNCMIMFFRCNRVAYLGALNGRLVIK